MNIERLQAIVEEVKLLPDDAGEERLDGFAQVELYFRFMYAVIREIKPKLEIECGTGCRWRGVLALGAQGGAAAPAVLALVDLLDDPDDNVRWTAATTLGKIGPAASDAVPALAAALADRGDPVIHKHAAAALASIGAAARDAVPGLIGALRDADADVREGVRHALSRIGPAAVPALIEALKEEDEQVRFEAADALTKIGTTSRP